MGILNDLSKRANLFSQEAKKTLGAKKLEMRIKSYRKEETELYTKLGRMLYQRRGCADDGGFASIFDNLDAIKARMKHLDQQITDIRSGEDETQSAYRRLDRKESDLTLTRTDEGIRLIRLCPACKAANSPADTVCAHCNHVFE